MLQILIFGKQFFACWVLFHTVKLLKINETTELFTKIFHLFFHLFLLNNLRLIPPSTSHSRRDSFHQEHQFISSHRTKSNTIGLFRMLTTILAHSTAKEKPRRYLRGVALGIVDFQRQWRKSPF